MTGSTRRPSSREVRAAILGSGQQIKTDDSDLAPPPGFGESQAPEPTAPPQPEVAARVPAPSSAARPAAPPPVLDLPEVQVTNADEVPYPTGFEISPALHAKVKAAAKKLSKDDTVLQTEVLLSAFDAATTGEDGEPAPEKLADIIAEAMKPKLTRSPLFGTRRVLTSKSATNSVRLQVRPLWGQFKLLQQLAANNNIKLTPLVRIVLEWYLKGTRARVS